MATKQVRVRNAGPKRAAIHRPFRSTSDGEGSGYLKILVHGSHGVGKTSFMLNFPDLFVLDCEGSTAPYRGTRDFDGADVDGPGCYEMMKRLAVGSGPEGKPHKYRTLGIDGFSTLQADYMRRFRDEYIEEGMEFVRMMGSDYPSVYTHLDAIGMLITRVQMNVVITCHTKDEYEDKKSGGGDSFDFKKTGRKVPDAYKGLGRYVDYIIHLDKEIDSNGQPLYNEDGTEKVRWTRDFRYGGKIRDQSHVGIETDLPTGWHPLNYRQGGFAPFAALIGEDEFKPIEPVLAETHVEERRALDANLERPSKTEARRKPVVIEDYHRALNHGLIPADFARERINKDFAGVWATIALIGDDEQGEAGKKLAAWANKFVKSALKAIRENRGLDKNPTVEEAWDSMTDDQQKATVMLALRKNAKERAAEREGEINE